MTFPIVTISKVILHTQTKLLLSVAPAYYQTMLFFIDTKLQCQNVNFAYAQVFNTRIAMQWTLVFSCEAQSQKNPKENGSVYGLCMEKPERRDGKLSAAPGFRKGHQCHRNGESANAVATI